MAGDVTWVLCAALAVVVVGISVAGSPQQGDRVMKTQIWDMHRKAPPRVLPMIDMTGEAIR